MYIIRVVDLRLFHLSLTPYEMHCPVPLHRAWLQQLHRGNCYKCLCLVWELEFKFCPFKYSAKNVPEITIQ